MFVPVINKDLESCICSTRKLLPLATRCRHVAESEKFHAQEAQHRSVWAITSSVNMTARNCILRTMMTCKYKKILSLLASYVHVDFIYFFDCGLD